ncbi:hypothetical protein ACFL59_12745 [Planctomycetota bacterium]
MTPTIPGAYTGAGGAGGAGAAAGGAPSVSAGGGPVTAGSSGGADPLAALGAKPGVAGQVPGGGAGFAGLGENVTGLAAEDAGSLTEGLTPEEIEELKKGEFVRAWFEVSSKAIAKVGWSTQKAVKGDAVKISVKAPGFDADTPVKFIVTAKHSATAIKDGAPPEAEVTSFDATLDDGGAAEVEWPSSYDLDARLFVEAQIEDKKKRSKPLKFYAAPPPETSGATEGESPDDAAADADDDAVQEGNFAFVGDSVQLMAECTEMPEDAQIKFMIYVAGEGKENAVASVLGTAAGNMVIADWQVEHYEDAEFSFTVATEFTEMEAEETLKVSLEAADDMAEGDEGPSEDEMDAELAADLGGDGDAVAAKPGKQERPDKPGGGGDDMDDLAVADDDLDSLDDELDSMDTDDDWDIEELAEGEEGGGDEGAGDAAPA